MDLVTISSLNAYLYCPRRCALRHVEQLYVHNEYTIEGTLLHEHADTIGQEYNKNIRIVRALPLFSDQYGLIGKADVVEFPRNGNAIPVEYKRGARRNFENDNVQLCAQALCLEEMFKCTIPQGAIYHILSRRRREVIFDESLREQTSAVISAVRKLLQSTQIPPVYRSKRCQGCSLHTECLPELDQVLEQNNLFRVFDN